MDNNLFPKPDFNKTDESHGNAFDDDFGEINATPSTGPVVTGSPSYANSQSQMQSQPVSDDDWGNVSSSNMAYEPNQPTGAGIVTATATVGIVFKCIVCALFPIFGFIVSGVSLGKGHKSRARIYRLVSLIAFILQMFISVGLGLFASKYADDIESHYSEVYDDYDDDYSYVDDYDHDDATEPDTTTVNDETKAASNATAGVNNTAWDEYTVYLSGQKIKLPMKWSEFSSLTGYKFDDKEDAKSTLKSNQYTLSVTCVNGEQEINVRIVNLGNSQLTYSDAWVGGINTYDYQDNDVVFAGNLTVGSSFNKQSMISALGQPDDVYDSDDSDFHIYTYQNEDEIYNKYEIQVSEGKITDISVEKFE